jgi:hypothetical protein
VGQSQATGSAQQPKWLGWAMPAARGVRTLDAVTAPVASWVARWEAAARCPWGTSSTARAIGGQGEDAGQGEEAAEHTERRCGVKWRWRRVVGTNPAADRDLRCSGLANQSRARKGPWHRSRRQMGGHGKGQQWWSRGEKNGGMMAVADPF